MKRAPMGYVNWRKDNTIQSFASPLDLKHKLTLFSAETKTAKSEIIRRAIEHYIKSEDRKMSKAKTTVNWKDLVNTLCELDANVPAKRVVEYLSKKGITVSVAQVGAVKAWHTMKKTV